MSDRLEEQLKELKNKPQAGAADSAWLAKNKALLMMQVKNTMPAPVVEKQLARTVESYKKRWFSPQNRWALAMRPVFVIALAVIIPFGSWISTVNAARLSVSGDALYSVKIISEKVQLAFTSDKSTKIALRTEFAARRADEVVKLKAQPAVTDVEEEEVKENIKKTIERLETEIQTASDELVELAESEEPVIVREAARAVDVKSEEIGRVLEKTAELAVEIPEINEAKELIDEVAVSAVETIVHTRTETEEDNSENEVVDTEIKNTLEDKLKDATSEIDEVLLILDAVASTNTPKLLVEEKELQNAQVQAEEALEVVKEAAESVDSEAFEEAIEKVKEVKTVVNEAQKTAAKLQDESQVAMEETEELSETVILDAENTTNTEKIIEIDTENVSAESEGLVEADVIVEDEPEVEVEAEIEGVEETTTE